MILVTGGSGFTGQHLVHALSAAGKQVRALYNRTIPGEVLQSLIGVEWMQCDLLDVYAVAQAMEGINQVYHCAAVVSFASADGAYIIHNNTQSTANLVNEALHCGVEKLVHLSSVAALGRAVNSTMFIHEELIWEEEDYAISSSYGISKYQAEMEVWRGAAEGLNMAIINPGIILGEGDWTKGSAKLISVVYGEFPYYTLGITAWVDVKDVVKAMMLLMDSNVVGERFILSAGNFGFKEVFTEMASALQVKPPHRKASTLLTELLWRLIGVKAKLFGGQPTITRETARSAIAVRKFENQKFLKAFPNFNYTSLPKTVKRMADAFKDSLK